VNRGVRTSLAAAGAVAAAAGAVYGAQRGLVATLRRRRGGHEPVEVEPEESLSVVTPDAATLHVVTSGDGQPVVFVHGFALTEQAWAPQLAAVAAAGYQAVAYDARGHGESSTGFRGFSRELLADDLAAVLEALDLHDVVLVGHSLGGITVQVLVERHPEVVAARVAALVLVATTSRGLSRGNRALSTVGRRIAGAVPRLSGALAHDDVGFWVTSWGLGRDLSPDLVERTRAMLRATAPATLLEGSLALLDFDLDAALTSIAVPTLVIAGRSDRVLLPGESRRIADRIPRSRLVVLPRAGHLPHLEQPDAFDAVLLEFLADPATFVDATDGPRDDHGPDDTIDDLLDGHLGSDDAPSAADARTA
jgi:pimeloyl-ACP methyl ester carboxylesterase